MNNFPDEIILKNAGMRGSSRIFLIVADYRYTHPKWPITVPRGTLTDGASVPKIFWSIFSPIGSYFPAALIHDFLYLKASKKRYGSYTRAMADRAFLDAMADCGVPWLTRQTIYAAVRVGGIRFFRKGD
jgi:hypothetical protein